MIATMAESTSTSPSATPDKTPRKVTPKPTEPDSSPNPTRVGPKPSVGTAVTYGEIPTTDDGAIVPTPGDPRTEPVATAAQSWVPGRVGPATVPMDATAATITPGPAGVDEVLPGVVLADTAEGLGRVPEPDAEDPLGERLARIAEDRENGVPLNDQGQRIDDNGMPLTGKAAVSR